MLFHRFRTLLVAPALLLASGAAMAQHTAHFDANAEGGIGTSYAEDSLVFSDLDRYLGGGSGTFVAEDASGTLAGFTGFSSPMALGFGGYSPGAGAAFSRCGSFKITPPAVFGVASVHFYVAGGSSGGNTVTLEAWLGGSLAASDQFVVPSNFGPHHYELQISGASFDQLIVVGAGSSNSGSFFALVDTVVVGSGQVGTGYCFGDPGVGTPCPCANDNDGTVPGSGCDNGYFQSGAQLTGSGTASVTGDTLVLSTTGLEPNNTGLYFQADNAVNGGNGNAFGDGLRCAGGALIRLQVRTSSGSGTSETSIAIATKGVVAAGDTKRYQCWYRTTVNPPCGLGLNDFNLSNGLEITWQP